MSVEERVAPATGGEAQDTEAIAEFDATRAVYEALKPLSAAARLRVLDHVSGLLEVRTRGAPRQEPLNGEQQEVVDIRREERAAPKYETFAELFDAAGPKTQAQMALVAGYWLQVCQGTPAFDAFSANRELKQLGHIVGNITSALEDLKNEKPALVLQIAKSGRTRQSRKTYKLSVAGIKAVEALIDG